MSVGQRVKHGKLQGCADDTQGHVEGDGEHRDIPKGACLFTKDAPEVAADHQHRQIEPEDVSEHGQSEELPDLCREPQHRRAVE
ncbi:hypothetical protein D3C78_732150 [compost metagenome]